MTTAIERVETIVKRLRPGLSWATCRTDDLTELVRLAKLGERVEQCEVVTFNLLQHVATPDSSGHRLANDLLAWIREEQP